MKDYITSIINDSVKTKQLLAEKAAEIEQMSRIVIDAYKNGGKLVIVGNGGSAADAQHIVAELVGLLDKNIERPSLPAIALTVNTSILTAIGNDFGNEEIFARQVEGMATEKDVVIGLSTSGNSMNIIKAFLAAKKKGAKTICWTGADGGKMNEYPRDFLLKVPSSHCGRIQESHITIGHIMCDLIEKEIHGQK